MSGQSSLANVGRKKRLLFLSPFVPSLSGGGAVMRVGRNVAALSSRFEIHLIVLAYPVPMNEQEIPVEIKRFCESSLKVPLETVGFPKSSGSIKSLRGLASKFPRNLSHDNVDVTVELVRALLPKNDFDVIFCFRKFSAVIIERMMQRGMVTTSSAVVDLDDLEYRVIRREAEIHKKRLGRREYWRRRFRSWQVANEVSRLSRSFDVQLVCSRDDVRELRRLRPKARVEMVPNVVEHAQSEDQYDKGIILFVGSFTYGPNMDGACWFCNEVMPILRHERDSQVKLLLVGRKPPPKLLSQATSDIEIYGTVPEVKPFYRRAQVCVAPVRYGGGTRIKILEALAAGRPVVSTSVGAEGLDLLPEEEILIADTPEEFATQIMRLFDYDCLYWKISRRGQEKVRESYSPEALEKILQRIV